MNYKKKKTVMKKMKVHKQNLMTKKKKKKKIILKKKKQKSMGTLTDLGGDGVAVGQLQVEEFLCVVGPEAQDDARDHH